jgi:hypothetical protein
MMKVPEENKTRFGVITIACAIGLNMITSTISNGPAWMMGRAPAVAVTHPNRLHINGDEVDFDMSQLGDVGREIGDAMRKGDMKTVPAAGLQALLPARVGSFERTGVESVTAGSGGPGGSHAEGTYEKGDQEFTLKVVDLAGFGAMAQMGGAFRIEKNREDKDGFEHVTNKDGTFVVEKWDNDTDEGRYTTIVNKRFLIEAKGEADSFDELKQAATSIDAGKLGALAKQ